MGQAFKFIEINFLLRVLSRSSARQFYFLFLSWNDLPNSIVTASNTEDFKNHLDSEDISKIIDYFSKYAC